MHHISFSKFIEIYWATLYEQVDFIQNIKVLYHLINKYNKKLFLHEFQTSIKNQNQWLAELMIFLQTHWFCDKRHIGLLYQKIQSNDNHFSIKYPDSLDVHTKIDAVIKARFDWYSLDKDSNAKLGIEIKGQWYQYKRNIDSDLDLLLQ